MAPLGLTCKEYSTIDEAAKAAMEQNNPLSIRDNLEYGGLLYKTGTGKYGFTGPVIGNEDGVNPWNGPSIPSGAEELGYWHTHGDYSIERNGQILRTSNSSRDDFNSDHFSIPDIDAANSQAIGKTEYKGYVGTPSGTFRGYDAKTQTQYTL